MSSLLSLSQQPWKRIATVAEGASVFLDDAAAELFHWSEGDRSENGGLLALSLGIYSLYTDLNLIAKDIIAQAPYCNVVIVCTKPLIGCCAERIASVLSDIQPLECHVFCAVSESMHEEYTPMRDEEDTGSRDGGSGYSHYGEFQALMRKWIKRESGVRVSVSHIDLFHIEIMSNLFCTPVYHDSLFSFTPSDLPQLQKHIDQFDPNISLESLNDLQFNLLPDSYCKTLKSFVQSFNSFLGSMDLQDDLYSVGPTSGLIADQLSLLEDARLRRKSASKKCSILFLDRSLDLATPCSHSTDYISDRLFAQLPSLSNNNTSNDVAINMAPLSQVDPRCLVSGCLAHPGCSKARNILNSLTFSKQKEAVMDLSRNLLEALSKEKISVRPAGRLGKLSPVQVKTFLEHFKNNPKTVMKHKELLQMACGVVEVMEQSKEWDLLCKEEQKIMQNLIMGDSAPASIVKTIVSIIDSQLNESPPTERVMKLMDIFCLIVEFYSLVGEECYNHITEEDIIKESLINLIMMRRDIDAGFLCDIGIDRDWSRLQIANTIDDVFDICNSLGTIRDSLTQYRDIYTTDNDNHLSPILTQILQSICDPSRPDLSCIRHHSHGLSNIIRSSFSLFMSSARPRPDNHPLLIIFLVGGISIEEIRSVKEFITINKPSFEVYLGSTRLLTPRGTAKGLLTKTGLLKQ